MDTKEFHISTTREILAIKDRVRHLIEHWGEDGKYKEAVLKTIIQRFIPAKFVIANGFVVKQTNMRGKHLCSTQIDLLIYDNSFPILFKEGDFVIVTPDSVRAIIEVKANARSQGLAKVAEKANELGQFIYKGKTDRDTPFYNGIFSFEGGNRFNVQTLRNSLIKADTAFKNDADFQKFKINHISFNKDWFLKFWPEEYPHNKSNYIYQINNLSFSFFISNLMDYLGGKSVIQNSNLWFPTDKSIKIKGTY
jgi:hypothetical protein